jgi:hypothetical protein
MLAVGVKLTLVLDLDHTLVECCLHDDSLNIAGVPDLTTFRLEIKRGGVTLLEQYLLKIRPGASTFLVDMCKKWDLYIYTKGRC